MAVVPYKNSDASKKKQVAEMFDNISGKYDFLNHVLSFQIDKYWRRKTIKLLKKYPHEKILDVATGTADFAIAARRANPQKVVGIDISEGMLDVGREKIRKKRLSQIIDLQVADSEDLPFNNAEFDVAVAGFGVRNFESLEKGLIEVKRVLKEGGRFFVLEFSKPESGLFRIFYQFYFKRILPFVGRVISKDKSAYTYLHDSVGAFPSGKAFEKIMEQAGYINIERIPLTFGIATIYIGQKPDSSK